MLAHLADRLSRVFRVEDVDNEDDPEEDQRGPLEDLGLERFGGLGFAEPEFRSDVLLEILLVPELVFQRQLGALPDVDVGIVPTGEANIWLCQRHCHELVTPKYLLNRTSDP